MFYTIWVFTLNKQLILSDRFYGVYFTPKSKSEIRIADLTEAHNRNLRNLLAKYSAHICVQKPLSVRRCDQLSMLARHSIERFR